MRKEMINKNRVLTILFTAFCVISLYAQKEETRPLYSNPVLTQKTIKTPEANYRSYRAADTNDLSKPFFDDFTNFGDYPVDSLWLDSSVLVTRSFAWQPPSLGVAVFDGLNKYGMPYNPGIVNSKDKIADKLTSVPIDFRYYDESDSIYLSFYYQPQGLGDEPESYDSFALEIKPVRLWKNTYWDSIAWYRIWVVKGTSLVDFKQVILPIPRYLISGTDTLANFYHKAFQFRFINYANLAGNVDHWLLDYVYLAKGRNYNDIYSQDLAVVEPPASLLKDYYSVPWNHLQANHSLMVDELNVKIRNLYDQPLKARGGYEAWDTFDNDKLLFNDNANSQDIYSVLTFPVLSDVTSEFKFNKVSGFEKFAVSYQVANYNFAADAHWANNYGKAYQEFSNYYAYDDGIPEKGYGIINAVHSKVAIKFRLSDNAPGTDSLRGLMIFFNQSDDTRMRMPFTLNVWNEYKENPVYSRDTITPMIDNSVLNRYIYYEFDSAISVNQTFYVGWEQFSDFFFNVGLDMNYYRLLGDSSAATPNPNLYYYVNGGWRKSGQAGALMIRPVFSDKPVSTAIVKTARPELESFVFPNPAKNTITILVNQKSKTRLDIISLQGQVVQSFDFYLRLQADVSGLNRGIYILRFTNGQSTQINKLVIE